jgi:hypothetical protein
MLTHLPCPEQSFGQPRLSQAAPKKPGEQRQSPVLWSQRPWFEHSRTSCALTLEVATQAQALFDGHVRLEQSGARYDVMSELAPQPTSQLQVAPEVELCLHLPWPLQALRQRVPPREWPPLHPNRLIRSSAAARRTP